MHSDAPALLSLFQDSDVRRYLPPKAPPTSESIERCLDAAVDEQEREGFSPWPLVVKETSRLIGLCGLHRMADGDVEVEWILAHDACGHGYATEAGRAALDFAFDVMKMKCVVALVHPFNSASIAVINRLGMKFDRVVRAYKRDLLRYTLTPEEH